MLLKVHQLAKKMADSTSEISRDVLMKGNKKLLLKDYPQLVAEWHPTRNEGRSIKSLSAGSGQKVWWKCPCGDEHEWEASVYERSQRGRGCPYCSGRRATKANSFGIRRPDLLEEWHPTKNKGISPFKVTPFSGLKVFWFCKKGKGHEWEASIGSRTSGNGCPYCSGHKVSLEESLATKYPVLAIQFDPIKNHGLSASEISPNHRKPIWWICGQNPTHSYQSAPITMCKQFDRGVENSCPECSSLKTIYPNLAKQWHPTKNLPNTPDIITVGSNLEAVWVCEKDPSHEWQQQVKIRVQALKTNVTRGSECPICLKRLATENTHLGKTHPILAQEWDHEKNDQNGLFLNQVTSISRSTAFWICSKNPSHRWSAIIRDRAGSNRKKGSGCPYCTNKKISSDNSLAVSRPDIAREWHPQNNGSLTPYDVSAGSNKKAFWECVNDPAHVWEAHIYSRTGKGGRGCPYCERWTIERIRLFVKSLANHIHNLTPAEWFVLFERSGVLNSHGQAKAIAKAIQSRSVSGEELLAFSEGRPSVVEGILTEAQQEDHNKDDSLVVPDSFEEQRANDVDPLNVLPNIQAGAALAALDKMASVITDEGAVKFFIASAKLKVWQHASIDEEGAFQQVNGFHGDIYSEEVKQAYMEEYQGAKALYIPKLADTSITPNLMQRLICFKVLREKRLGNWSGAGAGKTLSAVIASEVIKSKLTVVICPNNVIPEWEKTIPRVFPESEVVVKDFYAFSQAQLTKPTYLILNYEVFQQPSCRANLEKLVEKHRIDFCVLDEIHFTKQRGQAKMSIRKSNIFWFLQQIQKANLDLHVLGMSATPVINNIYEGKTLLELVTGEPLDAIETKNTMQNCMALHQMLIRYGVRIRPKYSTSLSIRTSEIDCQEVLHEIKHLGKKDILGLETSLTKVKLPIILQELRPKTLIYCHYVDTIIDMIKASIKEAGYSVAVFTGQEKDSLEKFTKGKVDVLLASRCISTGVDGLQNVCSRVIISSLPWTGAEFEQLICRVYRQGQPKEQVEIIVPLTFVESKGERRSWCQMRYDRIKYKKTIADAAVDGIIPEEHIRSPEQAFEDHMAWLRRLETEKK